MSFESVKSHMNDHHKSNVIDLVKKFGGAKEVKSARIESVDFSGLDIVYNETEKLRVEFLQKANDDESLKNAVIELCKNAKPGLDKEALEKEIFDFMMSFNSVSFASINDKGEVLCTYAPFVHTQWGDFVYLSEVGEHYANIKNNPNNIEAMFLEDESKAVSVIFRKRLRYKVKASFIERGELFDKVYDEFERQTGGEGGIKTIRKMLDFHLIRFEFGKGRFVKGPGQAYDLNNGEICHATGGKDGNPHKFTGHKMAK